MLFAFEHPRELRGTTSLGLSLMDVTYRAVRADARSIYAKNAQASSWCVTMALTGP
jgi:hypothetical protein